MWTRSELKLRGKVYFKNNYLPAVVVSVLAGAISTVFSIQDSIVENEEEISAIFGKGGYFESDQFMTLATVIMAASLFAFVLSIVLNIFVQSALDVGCKKFFIMNRSIQSCYDQNEYTPKKELPGVRMILDGFKGKHYLHIVEVMFCKALFTNLWTLLFIIPGIIKNYEYRMIPFILAESPGMSRTEVFILSKRMMEGEKFKTFVMDLTFCLWYLLSGLTLGILGVLYVNPYRNATYAELYTVLKMKIYEES